MEAMVMVMEAVLLFMEAVLLLMEVVLLIMEVVLLFMEAMLTLGAKAAAALPDAPKSIATRYSPTLALRNARY
eukprot:45333-Rhodomonas_salina.2